MNSRPKAISNSPTRFRAAIESPFQWSAGVDGTRQRGRVYLASRRPPPKTSRLVTNLDLRSLNVPTGTVRQTQGICRYGPAHAIYDHQT